MSIKTQRGAENSLSTKAKKVTIYLVYLLRHCRYDSYMEDYDVRKKVKILHVRDVFDESIKDKWKKNIAYDYLIDFYSGYPWGVSGSTYGAKKESVKLYLREVSFLEFEIVRTKKEAEELKKFFIKKHHTVTFGWNLSFEIDNELDYIPGVGPYRVYRHIAPNGKSYIGITKQYPVNGRWGQGSGYAGQKKFYNAIKRYGWENFRHEILKENLDEKSASFWEKYYILEFDSIDKGYNVDKGGLRGINAK